MLRQRAWLRIMVGFAIIVLLAGVSISRYQTMILHSREEVLHTNLAAMRQTIKQYIEDQQKAPRSLQQLVDSGYIRQLPVDPITNSTSSWKPVVEDIVTSQGHADRGITDLHSGSTSISSNGNNYETW
jgi:general secretion pathway protein G